VRRDLTTPDVLAMSFVPGAPIESLAAASGATRDAVAARMLALALAEIFELGLVQTDPNFANFRYDADRDRVGLLDFGATRVCPPERATALRRMLGALARCDRRAVEAIALEVGYLAPEDTPAQRRAVVNVALLASEPLRTRGPYDFAEARLLQRLQAAVSALVFEHGFTRVPPPDLVFIHRKLGGMLLLCAHLGARADVAALTEPYLP
jgi:predicted unusual protein kinase regulating ubiquinone biosynthesis (AarF/ABC1/UbiB family)